MKSYLQYILGTLKTPYQLVPMNNVIDMQYIRSGKQQLDQERLEVSENKYFYCATESLISVVSSLSSSLSYLNPQEIQAYSLSRSSPILFFLIQLPLIFLCVFYTAVV